MEIYLTFDTFSGKIDILDSSVSRNDLPKYISEVIQNISDIDTSDLPGELDTTKSVFYVYITEEDGRMKMLSNADFDFAVAILGKLIAP